MPVLVSLIHAEPRGPGRGLDWPAARCAASALSDTRSAAYPAGWGEHSTADLQPWLLPGAFFMPVDRKENQKGCRGVKDTRVRVSLLTLQSMAPFGSISFHPLIPEQTLACLGSWNGTEGAVSWMQTKLDTEAGTGTPARVPGHLSPDCRALGSRGRLVD